ncbi:MAG: hypothetical protein ABI629_02550 [bacterium]
MTYFGIASADNVVRTPSGETDGGVPIYDWPNQFGFILVLEGRPGTNNRPLQNCGTMGAEGVLCAGRAAPQILADRPLGNGSAAVCDTAPPMLGGVPGVMSLDFDGQTATDAINDLACRFDVHNSFDLACTFNDLGNFSFVRYFGVGSPNNSTVQYCSVPAIGQALALKSGQTHLKARISDAAGNVGNTVEIVVRVP